MRLLSKFSKSQQSYYTVLLCLEPPKPSSPITGSASTYSDINVRYAAVPDFNGPITGYKIYVEYKIGTGPMRTKIVTTSRKLQETISNLHPYTDHVMRYAAVNKIGEGPMSDPAAAIKTKEKGELNE